MTIIAPSILSANFLNLKEDIEKFNNLKDIWLHLDIMDGHFVPNLTFGPTVLKNLSSITTNKLDAHLMVNNPSDYIEPLSKIHVHNFTFHWEAVTHHDRLITAAKEKFNSVGVSLNPSTPISVIPTYLLEKIDLILVMSVNPGFGGQTFIEGCVDKVKELNTLKQKFNLNFHIQVDGGVNDKTASLLIDNGATNLVAGSYIFSAPEKNFKSRIDSLR